jgi:hypothetical protein
MPNAAAVDVTAIARPRTLAEIERTGCAML